MKKARGKSRKTKEAPKKEERAEEKAEPPSPTKQEEYDYSFEEPKVEWVPPHDQEQGLKDEELDTTVDQDQAITLRITNNSLPQNTCIFDFTKAEYVEEPPQQYQEIKIHFDMVSSKAHTQSQAAEAHREWLQEEAENRRSDAQGGEDLGEDMNHSLEVSKNQFNYSDRAAQTFNNPYKMRSVATKPPELRTVSDSCTSWKVYDHYVAKFLENEQIKASSGDKKSSQHSKKKNAKEEKKAKKDEDIVHCEDMSKTLKILERIVNQNSEWEIYNDYKYWEDKSDEFREGEGSLLPLWRFSHELTKRKEVTAICWNPSLPDLFAVGYGSYNFAKGEAGGSVLLLAQKHVDARVQV